MIDRTLTTCVAAGAFLSVRKYVLLPLHIPTGAAAALLAIALFTSLWKKPLFDYCKKRDQKYLTQNLWLLEIAKSFYKIDLASDLRECEIGARVGCYSPERREEIFNALPDYVLRSRYEAHDRMKSVRAIGLRKLEKAVSFVNFTTLHFQMLFKYGKQFFQKCTIFKTRLASTALVPTQNFVVRGWCPALHDPNIDNPSRDDFVIHDSGSVLNGVNLLNPVGGRYKYEHFGMDSFMPEQAADSASSSQTTANNSQSQNHEGTRDEENIRRDENPISLEQLMRASARSQSNLDALKRHIEELDGVRIPS